MSSSLSPTTYGTMKVMSSEGDTRVWDSGSSSSKDTHPPTSKSDNLYLSLNFFACLVLGPINFVVYKIMYDSYGEGRAFFVSQVRR